MLQEQEMVGDCPREAVEELERLLQYAEDLSRLSALRSEYEASAAASSAALSTAAAAQVEAVRAGLDALARGAAAQQRLSTDLAEILSLCAECTALVPPRDSLRALRLAQRALQRTLGDVERVAALPKEAAKAEALLERKEAAALPAAYAALAELESTAVAARLALGDLAPSERGEGIGESGGRGASPSSPASSPSPTRHRRAGSVVPPPPALSARTVLGAQNLSAYFARVQRAQARLEERLWAVVRRAPALARTEPGLLVAAARVVETQERVDAVLWCAGGEARLQRRAWRRRGLGHLRSAASECWAPLMQQASLLASHALKREDVGDEGGRKEIGAKKGGKELEKMPNSRQILDQPSTPESLALADLLGRADELLADLEDVHSTLTPCFPPSWHVAHAALGAALEGLGSVLDVLGSAAEALGAGEALELVAWATRAERALARLVAEDRQAREGVEGRGGRAAKGNDLSKLSASAADPPIFSLSSTDPPIFGFSSSAPLLPSDDSSSKPSRELLPPAPAPEPLRCDLLDTPLRGLSRVVEAYGGRVSAALESWRANAAARDRDSETALDARGLAWDPNLVELFRALNEQLSLASGTGSAALVLRVARAAAEAVRCAATAAAERARGPEAPLGALCALANDGERGRAEAQALARAADRAMAECRLARKRGGGRGGERLNGRQLDSGQQAGEGSRLLSEAGEAFWRESQEAVALVADAIWADPGFARLLRHVGSEADEHWVRGVTVGSLLATLDDFLGDLDALLDPRHLPRLLALLAHEAVTCLAAACVLNLRSAGDDEVAALRRDHGRLRAWAERGMPAPAAASLLQPLADLADLLSGDGVEACVLAYAALLAAAPGLAPSALAPLLLARVAADQEFERADADEVLEACEEVFEQTRGGRGMAGGTVAAVLRARPLPQDAAAL